MKASELPRYESWLRQAVAVQVLVSREHFATTDPTFKRLRALVDGNAWAPRAVRQIVPGAASMTDDETFAALVAMPTSDLEACVARSACA